MHQQFLTGTAFFFMQVNERLVGKTAEVKSPPVVPAK